MEYIYDRLPIHSFVARSYSADAPKQRIKLRRALFTYFPIPRHLCTRTASWHFSRSMPDEDPSLSCVYQLVLGEDHSDTDAVWPSAEAVLARLREPDEEQRAAASLH